MATKILKAPDTAPTELELAIAQAFADLEAQADKDLKKALRPLQFTAAKEVRFQVPVPTRADVQLWAQLG